MSCAGNEVKHCMKEEDKHKLHAHRKELLDDIADPKPVLDGLISRGILSTQRDDYQHILAGQYAREQTRRLLDLLPTLGEGAFLAFVESVASYRSHLGELLRDASALTTGTAASSIIDIVEDSGGDPDETELDRLVPFPPAKPSNKLVRRLQLDLRRSCISRAERNAAIIFGQGSDGLGGPGIDEACVTISTVNFDDVQTNRARVLDRSETPHDGVTDTRCRRQQATFASLCGDVDDQEELINVGKLFLSPVGTRTKSVLVVGPAGAGKSLLLERILECWAGGKVEVLSEFEFAVYVNGRNATALQSGTVAGMLVRALEQQIELNDKEKQALENYVKANPRRVLLLVDSADEGGEAWEKSKGLENLFKRRGLNACTFVVTSRPCPVAYNLIPSCKRCYYLIGLNDRRLDQLLLRTLGEEEGMRVKAQLKEPGQQHVYELMKGTPLVANLMMKLVAAHSDRAKTLPTCATQIFGALALDMIYRERVKVDKAFAEGERISTLDNLPSEVQEMVGQLGQLALNCLCRRQPMLLNMKTVKKTCSAEAISLGFLNKTVVKASGAGSIGSTHGAEFCHVAWLEFFAAHCLCRKLK